MTPLDFERMEFDAGKSELSSDRRMRLIDDIDPATLKRQTVMHALGPYFRDPDRKERRIGGSLAAAIIGVSSWSSPFDAYLELVEGVRRPVSRKMRAGKIFEHAIWTWACEELRLPSCTWVDEPITHPRRDWSRFSPDIVMNDFSELADVKRFTYADSVCGEPGTDQIGAYELVQLHTYAEALRSKPFEMPIERLRLIVHDLHRDALVEYFVPYDPELGACIVEACERFWRDHVETRSPPALSGSSSTKRYLTEKHPSALLPLRPATEDEFAVVKILQAIELEKKENEQEIEKLKNVLRDFIGDAKGLLLPEGAGTVTWTETKASEYTVRREAGRTLRLNFKKGR
jgi:hypothetical protein